jgi:type II secretory pathway pseudopilin PulG
MNPRLKQGYTSIELLLVLALTAMVMGGVVVGFGSLVRNQPRASSVVTATVGTNLSTYYGMGGTTITVNTAPNYGTVALAEKLREQFHSDVISATAVYCLGRAANLANPYHPSTIPYIPGTDRSLDTTANFDAHLTSRLTIPSAHFSDNRAFATLTPNSTIFVLGYSRVANELKVTATYDIDVQRITNPAGHYVSVKRYTNSAQPMYYDIFYTPSEDPTTDSFTPTYVTFEREARLANDESSTIQRFKRAAERPFYFIWWPDPGARDLKPPSSTSFAAADPRSVYNHQGGRTSFMFTVPMFPAL